MPFAIMVLSLVQLLVFFIVFLMRMWITESLFCCSDMITSFAAAFLALTGHLAIYGFSIMLQLAGMAMPFQVSERSFR